MFDATTVAAAFNQQNDKKYWEARAFPPNVHFLSKTGMVQLVYHTETNQFAVKFVKFHAVWGDYIKAIARSMYVVLNTLKSAGLPFEAPPSLAGMAILATTTADNTVFVKYAGEGFNGLPATLLAVDEAEAVMPEIVDRRLDYPLERALVENVSLPAMGDTPARPVDCAVSAHGVPCGLPGCDYPYCQYEIAARNYTGAENTDLPDIL